MAVKKIGFNDNFSGAAPKRAAPRAWGPGGTGWQAQQGLAPTYKPVGTNQTGATYTPTKPTVAAPQGPTATQPSAPASPAADPYSYDSDPVLQRAKGLATRKRDEATAEATNLRKQVVLDFGDEALARELFGGDESTVAAARDNPFATLARLKRSYDEQSSDTTTAYDRGRADLTRELTEARTERQRDFERGTSDLNREFTETGVDRRRDYDVGLADLNENLNKANLNFGGYAGTERGRATDLYQQTEGRAKNAYDTTLGRYSADHESGLAQMQGLYDTESGRRQTNYTDDLGDLTTEFQQGGYDARGQARGLLSEIDRNLAAALLGADESDAQADTDASGRAVDLALEYGIDPGDGAANPEATSGPSANVDYAGIDPIIAELLAGQQRQGDDAIIAELLGGHTASPDARRKRMLLEGLLW